MKLSIIDISYWKVIDHFKATQAPKDYNYKHADYSVFEHYTRPIPAFHIVAIWLWGDEWKTLTAVFDKSLVTEMRYFHLTGDLAETDYHATDLTHSEVDEYVLSASKDDVLKRAGYWPEYDESGERAWWWEAGPVIEEVSDDEVLSERIMGLLGHFSVFLWRLGWFEQVDAENANTYTWFVNQDDIERMEFYDG